MIGGIAVNPTTEDVTQDREKKIEGVATQDVTVEAAVIDKTKDERNPGW